jgi:GntR family transcriptional regulator
VEPDYKRIAEHLRQRIRAGEVVVAPDGSLRLPSYERLIEEYGTSYGTIRTVLMVLEAEGWIARKQGVAIFVRPDHPI